MSTNLDLMRVHNHRIARAAAMWSAGRDSIAIARTLALPEAWVWRNMEAIKAVAKQREAA